MTLYINFLSMTGSVFLGSASPYDLESMTASICGLRVVTLLIPLFEVLMLLLMRSSMLCVYSCDVCVPAYTSNIVGLASFLSPSFVLCVISVNLNASYRFSSLASMFVRIFVSTSLGSDCMSTLYPRYLYILDSAGSMYNVPCAFCGVPSAVNIACRMLMMFVTSSLYCMTCDLNALIE